jgi:hypothetical protein
MLRRKEKFSNRPLEDLETRRARQSIEGAAAMAEYLQTQKSVLERTARLRAERLEHERSCKSTPNRVA